MLARGRGHLSKVFSDGDGATPWLQPAARLPRELALCHLSAEIWRRSRSRSGEAYGLRLGAVEIPPGRGRAQRDRCLLALVLAAALPIALVLVLLVPRIGPFDSGLGGPSARARTGLSDGLDPGSISRLVADDGPAARVAFGAGQPPPPAQRYWRVLVHPRFDGQRWWRLEESEAPPPVGRGPGDPREREQTWLVEPSPFTAVPWSSNARSADPALQANARGELQLQRPAGERRSYRLWNNGAPDDKPGSAGLEPSAAWCWQPPQVLELSLPGAGNPRLRALGRGWAALPDPEQRLQAAEQWFRSQPFRYSPTPGALDGADGLDRFLFDEQLGLCGHYASAFSALMRAAGVPSRVVSGYLGGRWVVPLGGARYLELRQSDAHAWSEV